MNYTFIRNWIGFFILGSINNLSYVIVNSSALTLAKSFGVPNLVAVVPWANIALSIFIKGINTFFLIKVPYGIRFGINGVLMVGALLGVSFAPCFTITILFILLIGLSSGFGESVALEYLQKFDSRLVNAWASGTGFAGVLGASLYILFTCVAFEASQNDLSIDMVQRLKKMDRIAFWSSSPLPILYLVAYFIIITKPGKQVEENPLENSGEVIPTPSDESEVYLPSNIQESKSLIDKTDNSPAKKRFQLRSYLATYWKGFYSTLWLSLNLSGVYFMEYLVRTYASKSRPAYDFHPACPELYSALQFSYQAGVFVSRSSLQVIKIKHVEILTILQVINMALWFVNIFFKFLPIYLLPILMVYVGILGGASYVNIFYRIKTEEKFQFNRQVAINICSMWIGVGIFTASATDTIFDVTFLKNY